MKQHYYKYIVKMPQALEITNDVYRFITGCNLTSYTDMLEIETKAFVKDLTELIKKDKKSKKDKQNKNLVDMVPSFIKKHRDVEHFLMYYAIKYKNLELVMFLVNYDYSLLVGDLKNKLSPITFAIFKGAFKIARYLDEKGAIADFALCRHALWDCILQNRINKAAWLLSMFDGALVNSIDKRGITPLIYSVYNNSPEMVQILLDNGADPDIQTTKHKYTALMNAVKFGCNSIVDMLLMAGANTQLENASGNRAIDLGCTNGKYSHAAILAHDSNNLHKILGTMYIIPPIIDIITDYIYIPRRNFWLLS